MRTIDKDVLKAKTDSEFKDALISEYESLIMQTAYKVTGDYITKSDDRWSVSLLAFDEAIQAYSFEKGRFIPFAELVIRRRLYDFAKKQSRFAKEVPVNPASFGEESEEGIEDTAIRQQLLKKTKTVDSQAKLEIEAISQVLHNYGFTFFDLISASPKAAKTKIVCGKAVLFIYGDGSLLKNMRRTKNLPIKTLVNELKIPRKILERHRKYIIATIEILAGDYPVLQEYLSYIKRELSK